MNTPTDKIANRDPRDAIRDEDNDLLRALAAAKPSKILVSSRLTPRVLLNPSGQPIPGVKRITLPGLRPPDAEKLLRSCGIEGNREAIQSYLSANCDNHPLVIGILAGLINKPGRSRGNFDKWTADPNAGAALDLGKLDLIQRRNHILGAAITALSTESRNLLSTLALVSESVDYEMMEAFSPHIPPEPTFVRDPNEGLRPWAEGEWEAHRKAYRALSLEKKREADAAQAKAANEYKDAVLRRKEYLKALAEWKLMASSPDVVGKLWETVRDLEARGFLQFDDRTNRYDLHPVVRGVASGTQREIEMERQGQRVVDHFSAQFHRPFEEAETLEDLQSGLHIVRTLVKLGRFEQAAHAYKGDLANTLLFNIEAYTETLALLRPFFPAGWRELPKEVTAIVGSYLAGCAAIALRHCGEPDIALAAHGACLRANLAEENWTATASQLCTISWNLSGQNRPAQALLVGNLALQVAELSENREGIFRARLRLFDFQSLVGLWAEATANWRLLDPMGRAWSRASYRPGSAEHSFARFHFFQGTLLEDHLTEAERLAAGGKDRSLIRILHHLRGDWRLDQGEWQLAATSYQEAVRLVRDRSLLDEASETGLALAKHHLYQLADPQHEAERLAQLRNPAHRLLAQLWLALNDSEKAKHHALASYRRAWADGEPYVDRYELTKTTELLEQMKVEIPTLPPYDPAQDKPFPWEAEVRAAIDNLRAEKQAERESEGEGGGS